MAVAVRATIGPKRRPGWRLRRSIGPLTLTAATNRPAPSTTGALTDATPASRSATLSTHPLAAL